MSAITVKTNDIRFPVASDLYGLFFEDINRSGDGGLYPEMLRNRTFEDSILPDHCALLENGLDFVTPSGWRDQFNNGEGLRRWNKNLPPTPIPAWYSENATISLDETTRLNQNRRVSLHVCFHKSSFIYNIGYDGIAVSKDHVYRGYLFIQSESPCSLTLRLASADFSNTYGFCNINVSDGTFQKYDFEITSSSDDAKAVFIISSNSEAEVFLGYSSLIPADTFLGHGLRKDLVELLKNTSSRFLRFPGGCIVEGFTKETSMHFYNTIGPEWERPSHNLMWHYRTSNGLGYHEYLQLCEDLNLEALYVINCGITCQGRRAVLFEGCELDHWLQEAIDAIEYATAPADTYWGSKRAAAGHPDPFSMTYVEIGNENLGSEYLSRYEFFYQHLKSRFPDIKFIANIHVEKEGLPVDIVDEHYYNTPEYFARQTHLFDNYDRKGPEIFIGEYAVTNGNDVGNLRSAVAETMFLMGIENNQDIVTLTAYAPLFNHVSYTSWTPDLIAFDNHRSYGIPFYYALSMLASNRGKQVVSVKTESSHDFEDLIGLPGILASGKGVKIRNITCNGLPVSPSHNIVSDLQQDGDSYITWEEDNSELLKSPGLSVKEVLEDIKTYVTFGNIESRDTVIEAELWLPNPSVKTSIAFWIHNNTMLHNQDETHCDDSKLWTPIYTNRYVWTLDNHTGSIDAITRSRFSWRSKPKALHDLEYGKWMKIRLEARHDKICCYINEKLVQEEPNISFPVITSTASIDDHALILKIANIANIEQEIPVHLDCDVASEYEAIVLTHKDPKAENSFDNPDNVSPVTIVHHNAASNFTYLAPACSFSILKLLMI